MHRLMSSGCTRLISAAVALLLTGRAVATIAASSNPVVAIAMAANMIRYRR